MQRDLDVTEPLFRHPVDAHLRRCRHAVRKLDTASELLQGLGRKVARHLRTVRLVHEKARMKKSLRQCTVIRKEEQPFRILVEPSHRIDAHVLHGQKVEHRAPAALVGNGRDAALGLVQQEIDETLLCGKRLAVHRNTCGRRVRLRSRLTHHRAVYCHAPRRNELLRLAA